MGLCCAQGCGMSQACQLLLAAAVSCCCRGMDPGRAPATPSLLPSSLSSISSRCNLLDLKWQTRSCAVCPTITLKHLPEGASFWWGLSLLLLWGEGWFEGESTENTAFVTLPQAGNVFYPIPCRFSLWSPENFYYQNFLPELSAQSFHTFFQNLVQRLAWWTFLPSAKSKLSSPVGSMRWLSPDWCVQNPVCLEICCRLVWCSGWSPPLMISMSF